MSKLSIDKFKSANNAFSQTGLPSISSILIESSDQENLKNLTEHLNEILRELREQNQKDELIDCQIENLSEQNEDIKNYRELRNK